MTTLLSEEKIDTILAHCRNRPDGLFGEVGVFNGGFTCILSDLFIDAKIFAYDTFCGMPEKCWVKSEHHTVGEFKPKFDVLKILGNRRNVTTREGIFPDTIADETGFWMVHLDVDFYLSTLNSLKVLKDRMAKGGAIFLDDWDWPHCPGVRQAVEELGFKAIDTVKHQAVIQFQ
jgi:O-methyltransferase